MPDEKVKESAFEVLKYGKQKELRIRDLFSRLMSFVGNQRSVDSGQNLSNNYLRPYSKRRNFSLEQRPKYLPFEIFAYFRNHWTLELEEVDDPKVNEMRQMQFMSRSMFRFDDELVVNRFSVLTWDLNYCLFQPTMVFGVRVFLQ